MPAGKCNTVFVVEARPLVTTFAGGACVTTNSTHSLVELDAEFNLFVLLQVGVDFGGLPVAVDGEEDDLVAGVFKDVPLAF